MKYTVKPSSRFKKELEIAKKRGYNIDALTEVITMLSNGEKLPAKYKDHVLTGGFAGKRECHIQPDWLLIYEIFENELLLYLARTGTHSDLFN